MSISLAACVSNNTQSSTIANPASTFCVQQGGQVSIETDKNQHQYGICTLPNGHKTEEWDYFRSHHH